MEGKQAQPNNLIQVQMHLKLFCFNLIVWCYHDGFINKSISLILDS